MQGGPIYADFPSVPFPPFFKWRWRIFSQVSSFGDDESQTDTDNGTVTKVTKPPRFELALSLERAVELGMLFHYAGLGTTIYRTELKYTANLPASLQYSFLNLKYHGLTCRLLARSLNQSINQSVSQPHSRRGPRLVRFRRRRDARRVDDGGEVLEGRDDHARDEVVGVHAAQRFEAMLGCGERRYLAAKQGVVMGVELARVDWLTGRGI